MTKKNDGEKIVWLTEETKALFDKVLPGQSLAIAHPKGWRFNAYKCDPSQPSRTLSASADAVPIHWEEPRRFTAAECQRIQGFPDDYDFNGMVAGYVCGMSVPPPMMQRVAREVAKMLDQKIRLPRPHTGPWTLKDLRLGKLGRPAHGMKVFSCFHCGGGSTMGYKLAGFDVLGGVEIDPDMMAVYRKNFAPARSYLMGIQEFKLMPDADLPRELFSLDVLDGSPPCSSFSVAGSREKKWGKSSKFREGQVDQVLDDLFFHFIDVAKKLRPKVVVAENVKGLVMGNARGYVKEIFSRLRDAGYETQLFVFNASRMGVPQRRERTFFVARRGDLKMRPLRPEFNEQEISVRDALRGIKASRPVLVTKAAPADAGSDDHRELPADALG